MNKKLFLTITLLGCSGLSYGMNWEKPLTRAARDKIARDAGRLQAEHKEEMLNARLERAKAREKSRQEEEMRLAVEELDYQEEREKSPLEQAIIDRAESRQAKYRR
ncbi:MAG: hypothetical protein NT124_05135 [Candidatus Dependentiae bacterium]|nr:hypothetical protein [Candidatus Dependentiae bacterium]